MRAPMQALTDTTPHPAAAALRVEYRQQPLDALLADPQLLAVFGFGDAAPSGHADPRYLQVALPAQGDAPFECWMVAGEVRSGREAGIAWSANDGLQFGAIEMADAGDAAIETAAADAYARLQAWLASSGYPHALRIWNYMDAITDGEGDDERYRRFCVGRARGIGRDLAAGELPAATAIGSSDGRRRLQVYWLASSEPGTPVENPRQVSAWRYPRQYGPQSPSFARAMLPPAGAAMPLLLSGTAAVVGHASQHSDSVAAQLDETLANLDSLVGAARGLVPSLPPAFGAGSALKVYVRDRGDAAAIAAQLDARLDPAVPRMLLHAQVCRRELRVEIDGVHGAMITV